MKLVKIGRAQGCNIQINNPVVSGLHAELLILDDGKSLSRTNPVRTEHMLPGNG